MSLQNYPSILQAIGLTALVVLLLQFLTLFLFVTTESILPRTAIFLLGYVSSMGLSIWLGNRFRMAKGAERLPFFQEIDLKIAFIITIATFTLNIGLISPITDFIPVSDSIKLTLKQNLSVVDGYMFLAIVFGAPFFEEYLFRGIMLDGLLKNYRPAIAIGICSLLFGLMHLNPLQFVSAGLGGIFLGWIYFRTKNLIYCMLIHLVINLTGFISIKQLGIDTIFEKGIIELYGGPRNAMLIVLVCLLIFTGCVYILNTQLNKKNSNYNRLW